ncbi:uncharacterized protein KQ657_004822 [Scheffersomyces spartinae]|uniref:Uncharacterized protein n=1 Tax=Scheffersomyces spartinae TaxID=45513 RepID=A0A9P8AIS2_9ASCO|nr:uncharacterized protein KQ657_004822 [Scheffersomyces spartinae]KAG7194114.1 hypothetical protein KQ657_004822 [Scheffersomyces spartinae]
MVSLSELIAAAAILVSVYIVREWFLSQRDVHPLYLEEQSSIEPTRLPDESAIYRSNKLDLPDKLRIGLDIRYDHYKLRNGNLHDVWAIYANTNGGNGKLSINDKTLSVGALNYRVTKVSQALKLRRVSEVVIPFKTYQKLGFPLLAVILGAFVLSITVHIVSGDANIEEEDGILKLMLVSLVEQFVTLAFGGPLEPSNELNEFPNAYDPADDKGAFLKVSIKKLVFQTTVEYQVINAISAIAATLKHLPFNHELSNKDKLVIVQDTDAESMESVGNEIVKLLCGLTAACGEVAIVNDDVCDPLELKPTVMVLPQTYYLTLALTNGAIIPGGSSWLLTLRENLLSRGIMVTYGSKFAPLRLIYVHKPMGYGMHPLIEDSNQARSLFQSRIVVEHTWLTILGPVLATDFFDYRVLPVHVRSYGALSQSLEFKLVNVNDKMEGTIKTRGFTIGKLTNKKNGMVQQNSQTGGSDGFMPIPLPSKFGKDGVLYVL